MWTYGLRALQNYLRISKSSNLTKVEWCDSHQRAFNKSTPNLKICEVTVDQIIYEDVFRFGLVPQDVGLKCNHLQIQQTRGWSTDGLLRKSITFYSLAEEQRFRTLDFSTPSDHSINGHNWPIELEGRWLSSRWKVRCLRKCSQTLRQVHQYKTNT